MEIINNKTLTFYESKSDSEKISIEFDEKTKNYQYSVIDSNSIRLIENGKSEIIYISSDNDNYYIFVDGKPLILGKVNEDAKDFSGEAQNLDKQIVYPPMPGSIVKVEVEKGQKVKEADPLIIVEAMKMESVIYSSLDGIVSEVNVTAGQQVSPDTILLVVDKE